MTDKGFRPVFGRQNDVYAYIVSYTDANKRPPNVREIQEAIGSKSPRSVGQFLDSLEKAGLIKRGKGSRNIAVVDARPHCPLCKGVGRYELPMSPNEKSDAVKVLRSAGWSIRQMCKLFGYSSPRSISYLLAKEKK